MKCKSNEKKPVSGKKKFIVYLLCFVIVLFTLIGCLDILSDADSSSGGDNASSTVTINDALSAENFDFTIISASHRTGLKNQLNVPYTPAEGKQFLFMVFNAKNTTDETRNVMYTNFNAYIDNQKITVKAVAGEIDGYMPLIGAVAAGKEFKAYVVWEVPQSWSTFELSYIDALTGSESRSFKISFEDIR